MSSELISLARACSRVLGWTYVLAWSCSFYPQPTLNWRRKSTLGLTIDFPALNLLGFAGYTACTSAFLFSPTVKRQYARRHPLSPETTVRFNDFVFALHALVLCAITYSQFYPSIWGLRVARDTRANAVSRSIIYCSLLGCCCLAIYLYVTGGDDSSSSPNRLQWIDLIYAFEFVKLICTLVKYIPQAYSNYERKSTVGWSIDQVILDFTGSILSFLQLFIDSALQADWSGMVGNPVKFGLSILGLFYTCILMTQHYILYPRTAKVKVDEESENSRLLANGRSG